MFDKGRKKGTIRLCYMPSSGEKQIQVAGDFTDWQPVRMRKQKDGAYVASLPVEPGRHQYKFIIDGQWRLDQDNPDRTTTPDGSENSVLSAEQ